MSNQSLSPIHESSPLTEIVSRAPGLLCLLDDGGRCLAVSEDLANLVAVAAAELIGRPWDRLIDRDDVARFATGDGAMTVRLRRGDGTVAAVEWTQVAVDGGRRMCAVRDLTAPGRGPDAEPRLRRSEVELVETERLALLGSLAGGVAHQINDALTATRLSLGRLISFELAQKPLTTVRQHRIELLQDAREGVARVEHITHELRAFSQADVAADVAVELGPIVEASVSLAAHEIRHRARLVRELGPLPAVNGGEQALRQVFLNILLNAAQSMPEGAADINEVKIATWTDAAGQAVVEVSDTGGGIPVADLNRIFEPFFTTRRAGEGLGLGLSVCREIVASLHGQIIADSEAGWGTRVRVVLPPAAPPVPAVDVATAASVATDRSRRRILIVDDDRPVAAAVALELEDHDVVVAGSGREALEILRRDPGFDVVLCDVMMPDVSGMDLFAWLQPIEPALAARFVFMTGGAFTLRAERFLRAIANPCIDKPFHADDLRRVISEIACAPGVTQDPAVSIRTTLAPRIDGDARPGSRRPS